MSTLNAQMLNTLRVIAEGETLVDDKDLLPTTLFDHPETFNDVVVDMLQGSGTPEEIRDLIKYAITVDTNIRYRYNPDEVAQLSDGDGIPPSAFAQVYDIIDRNFNVSEGQAVAGVMDGTVSYVMCGLAGVIRRNYKELYEDDSVAAFYNYIALHASLSRTNPSSLECWWLDTLFGIYSQTDKIESIEDTFFTDAEAVNIAIENWYCEFVRPLQQFWDDAALVANEYNPNHLISYLYDDLQKTFEDLYETGIAKVESGFVSPISSISVQKNVTNVEQMMFALLTSE